MKIMIVEDDEVLAKEMALFLTKWKYEAIEVRRFENITEEYLNDKPQLILMDINLPYFDGFYWCNQIRQISKVPIIYISSRNHDSDKIMAIAQGGDDYLEKPFRLELLKAKIDAMVRRTYEYKIREQIKLSEELCFDKTSQQIYYKGNEIELTKSERRILAKLVECRPNVVIRDELMMELWNTDEYVSDGTLTTLISRLRTKLKSSCGVEIIQTRKGQGYFVQ
ncbi:MAG: response regulator transcription factor [Lachnospiraceae bacterium]|nr:response regulator transcription factor [Lachnospiraceae bacterium]MBQ4529842.1 response regulator transcription factor [Lachnospiraceae bacterium]